MYLSVIVLMASGEPAGFGYWIGVLVDCCGLDVKSEVPREKRGQFRKLARLLVSNEFEHVSQLRDGVCCTLLSCVIVGAVLEGTDPSRWIGAKEFIQSDLDILRKLVRGGRSRSPVRNALPRCGYFLFKLYLESCVYAGKGKRK